ncbi:hypothetical protein [uncultured Clostridium sp.]|uniref:hypothetical protein n=1 Tax=uncultured Clostridium sp. TaxID=59620 RepID=UPI0025F35E1A|nr:hypothetical protein [uncultured Clostridium sp.]MDU4884311.1 hypothetical protein [Clostridium celatum]MDU7077489.1 hypothetical protein [Clostridium celatum]
MKECTKCKKVVTTEHSLCISCRKYYQKRYRLQKIKKHKLFFVKNDEEIKLIFTENENEIKEFLKRAFEVVDFTTWEYPIQNFKLLKQLIEIIEFRLNANVEISSKATKYLVEFIEENKIILKENY